MNISLQGFDCKYATFRLSGDPAPRTLVNVIADGTVATAQGAFTGVLLSKHGENGLVQLSGYAKLPFIDTAPAYGRTQVQAENGALAAATSGGQGAVVVDVDDIAGTVGIIL